MDHSFGFVTNSFWGWEGSVGYFPAWKFFKAESWHRWRSHAPSLPFTPRRQITPLSHQRRRSRCPWYRNRDWHMGYWFRSVLKLRHVADLLTSFSWWASIGTRNRHWFVSYPAKLVGESSTGYCFLLTCTSVPPNLSFLVDDSNEEWVFRQKFDFIHARQLHCSVEEQKMTRQAYEYVVLGIIGVSVQLMTFFK